MKKYIVVNTKTGEVFGRFETESLANQILLNYYLMGDGSGSRPTGSIFDYKLSEIEATTAETITSYEKAVEFLGLSEETKKRLSTVNDQAVKPLILFNKLLTIAQAWNKADGFTPDFTKDNQMKYYPTFLYNPSTGLFDFFRPDHSPVAGISTQVCFATAERAKQFGEQFIDLWNDFLL